MNIHHPSRHMLANSPSEECDMYSFHLILFSDSDEMSELWLPTVPEGFFHLGDNSEYKFLSILSRNGQWVAVCKKPAFFRNVPMEQSCEITLSDRQLLVIDYEDRNLSLYVEKISSGNIAYHNYHISSETEISIGNSADDDIYYNNQYVSGTQAVLRYSSNRWTIQNHGSRYGVYVNGKKCNNAILTTGDVVCIMGLKLIVGPNLLSINCGAGKLTLNKNKLQVLLPVFSGYSYYHNQDAGEGADTYFNRAPRKKLEMPQKTISVEGPPMSMDQKQIPLMLRMGSSMVMGGTAALAGNFTTLISSVLFPFLSSKFTDKQRNEYEQMRLSKYTEYLSNKRQEIEDAITEEKLFLNKKYPTAENAINVVLQKSHLWERRPGDSDFLRIRLGTGTRELGTTIEYPARRFELDTDKLEEQMYQLVEGPHNVDEAPIVISLPETCVCGLLGPREMIIEYLRQLVLQITAFHSYDEVKTVFFLDKKELVHMDELRYLPHVWDDQRAMRFIATDEAEAYKLGEYIKDQLAEDKAGEKDLGKILKRRPYYVIFALNKKLFESHEALKDIMQSGESAGITAIAAYDDLPKESQSIITLESVSKNILTSMSADGGEDIVFKIDRYGKKELSSAMRILANTRLKTAAQAQEIPKMVTFLEMFGTGRIEQLNPLKRWQENNPVKSLAAPVGLAADGSLFTLDLHEKRQGPHGLVAGMTGSGKSEFIITYILSMAVNYHPDEVAFVLIDYKGGGLAGAFENPQTGVRLPHLVGTITNLDGASIQRSLMSIESELIRRQKVFNDVKSAVNEGTMDIYAYQKLYRAGKVSEPMPHLFIISDEFAELKQQQPEFMDKLISAARIGRSLGVHLILATQKPSGVVNDQIRSNTKFRVCLRVQERSDSMDMLKRPEAAELTDTGRFYLQVGYNEYFAMGQSAWCGAPYEPQDTVITQRDDSIEVLDTSGQVISKIKPQVKKTDSGVNQLVAIVKYLSDLAKAQGIDAKQLWKPELPKLLDLEELQTKYASSDDDKMTVTLGLVDDPENQDQFPLKVDFRTCQNMLIIGDSGSGKTNFIQNILHLLSKQLSPEDFNFYALDYSSRMLKLFKPLPHCGAILQEEESNSLDNFFKLINAIVAERKRIFSELEVDSFEAASTHQKMPLILVVIDNISGMGNTKSGETHQYKLQGYMKNSSVYGIKYIISCSHLNEAPSRIRQETGICFCTHLKDKYDYGEMLGCKTVYAPPELPGRGLHKHQDRLLEFHSAIVGANLDDSSRVQCLKNFVNEYKLQFRAYSNAQRLPVIDKNAEYRDFADQFTRGRIPLGYSIATNTPVAIPLKQMSALSFYLGNPDGTIPVIENVLYAAERERMELWVVKRNNQSYFDSQINSNKMPSSIFSVTHAEISRFKDTFFDEISCRLDIAKEFSASDPSRLKQANAALAFSEHMKQKCPPLLILFESFAEFCQVLDTTSEVVINKYFSITKKLNVFLVGFFAPDDEKIVDNCMLYSCFNPENNIIMLGGQFNKQNLCDVPTATKQDSMTQFNTGLMYYKKNYYPLLMPCGIINTTLSDPDDNNIFALV